MWCDWVRRWVGIFEGSPQQRVPLLKLSDKLLSGLVITPFPYLWWDRGRLNNIHLVVSERGIVFRGSSGCRRVRHSNTNYGELGGQTLRDWQCKVRVVVIEN